jgi:hypothetical protein
MPTIGLFAISHWSKPAGNAGSRSPIPTELWMTVC